MVDIPVDNSKAIQRIQYLHVNHSKKRKQAYKAIEEAFDIYDKLTNAEAPTPGTINEMLKLFVQFGYPNRYIAIWGDIEKLAEEYINHSPETQRALAETDSLSWPLLMKCCISLSCENMDSCLQVFAWMETANYTLNLKDKYISNLVNNCGIIGNIDALNFIYKQFEMGTINCDEIYIKTVFIKNYSKLDQFQMSKDIFNSIETSRMNMICYGSMMQCCMDHGEYDLALELYYNLPKQPVLDTSVSPYTSELYRNDIVDSIAIQACIKAKDYAAYSTSRNYIKGKFIHKYVKKKLHDDGKDDNEMDGNVRNSLFSWLF